MLLRFLLERFTKSQTFSLDDLQTSDMVTVSLKPEFCTNMLNQTQERFSQEDLEKRMIQGTVVRSVRNPEHRCWLGEIHVVKKTPDGVRLNTHVVLEDEVESVKVHARAL